MPLKADDIEEFIIEHEHLPNDDNQSRTDLPSTSLTATISNPSSSFGHGIHLSSTNRQTSSPSSTSQNKPQTKKKNTIDKYTDRTSLKEIEDLNEKLASFFFGCNIPFNVIDSEHFKNFIKSMRPSYAEKLPGRKALSTSLLDNAYDRCLKYACSHINPESVLLIDGWKNTSSNTKTVVSMLHNAKGSQAFVNAWDLTLESETGNRLSEIVIESIEIAKNMYNTDVYAVVSDNAAAMLKMGRTVDIWHSTCSSHTANLLAKDVLEPNLTKKVTDVLKEFKHADFERALVDRGGTRIKTPVDTRWCSYRDSYECLLKNIQIMKVLIATDVLFSKIKPNIKNLIFDDEFLNEVKENITLFDPICALINIAQKSDTSAADIAHIWVNLQFPTKFSTFNEVLQRRQDMALNIYVLCAYYLHPKFKYFVQPFNLSHQKLTQIQDFLLENLDGDGIKDLNEYEAKASVFRTLFEKKIEDPIVFWNTAALRHKSLSSLALKLLRIPASSAQIERLFSTWSYVHSPLRNRLEFIRSKKLLKNAFFILALVIYFQFLYLNVINRRRRYSSRCNCAQF